VSDASFGIRDIQIRGFRSARSAELHPGGVCALVGGPSVGKSNVLEAIWTLLQRGQPTPTETDRSAPDAAPIELRARLAGGEELVLEAYGSGPVQASGSEVPVLFLPAAARSRELVAGPITSERARKAAGYFQRAEPRSAAAGAAVIVAGVEALRAQRMDGVVLLIEEPELFLRPQTQRYLYRLLRQFALAGNQVIYSTHEPAFLNVGRLEELAFVQRPPARGTTISQPHGLDADAAFRAISEVDAERGELFLASAVLLVEGRTEKLTLPFIFRALGQDIDREAITIVDCGGKPNIPLFIRICHAVGVPCVAVHDRDAAPGRAPSHAEQSLNSEIEALAGADRTIELARDFEAVAGLRGHRHKPTHAFEHFAHVDRAGVPEPLRQAVERVVALARG
jgi:predicted ATP-dependent endonuclease of OLD family